MSIIAALRTALGEAAVITGTETAIGLELLRGIGTLKRSYLHLSHGSAEIALMRSPKAALDPRGILTPGKVI